MGDPEGDVPETQRKPELSDELSRSLGSIWRRHAGGRPSAATIEISGNVVTFVMVDAVSAPPSRPRTDRRRTRRCRRIRATTSSK